MAIDAYRKDVESKTAPPAPERAPGTRFADVMQDRESPDSAHFALWVENTGGDAQLAKRFASGQMKEGDQDKLRTGFEGFEKRKEKVNEIVGQMTPDQMKVFAKRSPLLKDAVELGGPDRIAAVFRDHLERLAFEEPVEFAGVERQYDALSSFRQGAFKTFDEDVTKRSQALGITEQKYSQIMQMTDEKERNRAFRAEVKSSFGWFQKPADWKYKVKELGSQAKKDELDRLVKDLDNHEYQLGSALGILADKNETVRTAVNQELLGMREKPAKLLSFVSATEAMNKFGKSFDIPTERNKFYDAQGYAGKPDKEKRAIEGRFNKYAQDKLKESAQQGGGGKWLEIIMAIFGMKVKNE